MHRHYNTTLYPLATTTSPLPTQERAVALGLFDGLHIGHRAVITAASIEAAFRRLPCAVYTFQPDTVTTKPTGERLCSTEDMLKLLPDMGVDELLVADFATLQPLSPAQFVTDVLHHQLHAKVVVCGYNYRFAHGGQGNVSTLQALCAPLGMTVLPIDAVNVDKTPVSATRIRAALAEGDMPLANRMLGRSFGIHQPVHHGQGLGRTWGIPTINQPLPTDMAPLRYGVYASVVQVDDTLYTGVTNIGVRPTVGSAAPLAETFVEGLSQDIYGKTVTVYPVTFLRPEQTFPSLEALREQIHRDIAAAHDRFHGDGPVGAILFDYDDTLNRRDACFTAALRRVMAVFYPHLSAEEFDRRLEDMVVLNGRGYHMPCDYDEYTRLLVSQWGDAVDPDPHAAWRMLWAAFPAACFRTADALDTLLTLKARGYKLGVITNGGALAQRRKLDFSGLLPLFDTVLVGGEQPSPKPHPSIFHRAAAQLGLAPSRCVMVGDHPVNDLQAASAVGMQTVFVQLDGQQPAVTGDLPPHTPTVTRLADLLMLPFLTE